MPLRIIFIGGFQGDKLISTRNIIRNRSLAGSKKMGSICSALASKGYDVTLYSEGRAAERTFKIYRSLNERIAVGHQKSIDVIYGETLDFPVLGSFFSLMAAIKWLPRLFKKKRFDVAFVYNCDSISVFSAFYCSHIKKIPVILEYEDSVVVSRRKTIFLTKVSHPIKKLFYLNEWIMRKSISGSYGPSPELAEAICKDNCLVVPGALSIELIKAAEKRVPHSKKGSILKILYCGNLDPSKGADMLIEAANLIDSPLEVHICGKGVSEDKIRQMCDESRHKAYFHGVVSNEELVRIQTSCDVAVNPHRTYCHKKGELWPFKVVEYLAVCGIVVSSRTGKIEEELEKRLHIYEEDTPDSLAQAIKNIIDNWENETKKAPDNMAWAAAKWGPEGIAKDMEQLLSNAGLQVNPREN